jgi:hypothetical protein
MHRICFIIHPLPKSLPPGLHTDTNTASFPPLCLPSHLASEIWKACCFTCPRISVVHPGHLRKPTQSLSLRESMLRRSFRPSHSVPTNISLELLWHCFPTIWNDSTDGALKRNVNKYIRLICVLVSALDFRCRFQIELMPFRSISYTGSAGTISHSGSHWKNSISSTNRLSKNSEPSSKPKGPSPRGT